MTTWSEYKKKAKYPKLEKNISADVAVIGGGITGLLCAYALSKAGKRVVLIEKEELLSDATIMTTAFITKVIDTELAELVSIWGDDASKKVFESGQAAIEEFEKIIKSEGIECEFTRCSNYIFASTKKQAQKLQTEAKEYKRLGIPAILEHTNSLGFSNMGYLRVPQQAKFHVSKFAYELAAKMVQSGVQIFEKTVVKEIKEGEQPALITPKGTITAQDIIVATYQPLTDKKTHLKKGMYMSYVFEVEVPQESFPEGLYEDLSNPYYYFRVDRGEAHDRMIIGGEDHREILGKSKTLQKKSFESLRTYLEKLMEGRAYKITKEWTGPILEPSDGLPLIGRIAPHLYVATAFSGNGMTYSMISSIILRDLILEGRNPWSELYDPKRSILHPKRLAAKARDYTAEFFSGAVKNLLSK